MVLQHVHTWVRWKKNFGAWQFKCADPDCDAVKDLSYLVGKRTKCSICFSTEFILTKVDLKRVRPRCLDCSETKDAIEHRRNKKIVEMIFEEQAKERGQQ